MRRNPRLFADFMMKFELGLLPEDVGRGFRSALTIGGAYIVGGLIPLTPYILFHSIAQGLVVSIVCTLVALFVFGFVKGRFTGARPLVSALQTVMVGALAAAAAFALAKAITR
jgi:predicted membrane protein (TIGR00267 family)